MPAVWLGAGPAAFAKLPVEPVRVPPSFHVEVLTDAIPAAREMALSPAGTPYIGSRAGKVYAISLRTLDALIHVVASGPQSPVGMVQCDGNLYMSAVSYVLRVNSIDSRLGNPPDLVVVNDKLPAEAHHGWKFIAFGPDGRLYVPVSTPCNICRPDESQYANLIRVNADGSRLEFVARDTRNTVGFDWYPSTHELWFTGNDRDLMGDDVLDGELNRITEPNSHFDYPFCHADDIPDPEFGAGHPCSGYTPPATKLGAHAAALGMRFYAGSSFPPEYRNNVFIAEHGSWNQSPKMGYRVVRVVLDAAGNVTKQKLFVQGRLQDEGAWGHPADVLVVPDGSLPVSDDLTSAVYRTRYTEK